MSSDPSTRPDPDDARASADETSAILSAFTRAHVKALLLLASRPAADPTVEEAPGIGEIERGLDECAAGLGVRGAELIQRATALSASVGELRGVKMLAKILFSGAEDQTQRNAITLLYHLAIAAAYARHGEHITSLPWSERRPLYTGLARDYSTSEIGRTFQEAVDRPSGARLPG